VTVQRNGPSVGGSQAGVWLGAGIGALGWALSALMVARGGGYLVVVPHLAVVVPVAAVGTITALAASGVGRPAVTTPLWLLMVALAGFSWNFVVYWVRFGVDTWGLLIPLAKPTGIDFRDGLYQPAIDFTTVRSGWPPLTLILGKPFTLFGFGTAHAIELTLLATAAVACVVLCAVLAVRVAQPQREAADTLAADSDSDQPRDALWLGVVAGVWLFTSVGFIFEMERGNIDLFALFFSLFSVWLMLGRRSPWWPALVLAIAINLKLYPGVLLVLLLWRYRWRAIVPAVVTNVVLLLIAGPQAVRDTISGQTAVQTETQPWQWANHSAASLSVVLRQVTTWAPSWVYWPLLLIPVAIWLVTMAVLVRRGWCARGAVIGAAACVPLMGVVPAVSVEYQLVLCVFPLTVLAALVASARGRGALLWSVQFGLVAWAMMMLARSSVVVAPSLQTSKYALLVLLQLLLLAAACLNVRYGSVNEAP
jgi:hypothetical protein